MSIDFIDPVPKAFKLFFIAGHNLFPSRYKTLLTSLYLCAHTSIK
jgi:hypothetical protein